MTVKLPKVQTKKEFMDHLEDAIHPPKYEDAGYSTKGRLRELKTYILESNEVFPAHLNSSGMSFKVIDTGLKDMKILYVDTKTNTFEFFLDITDKRFLLLHTNEKSEDSNKIINTLTRDHHHMFDNTWFYSNMLKRFCDEEGNSFKGFGVSYSDKVLRTGESNDSDIEDLTLSISGSLAKDLQNLVETNPNIRKTIAYNKVQILRGSKDSDNYVQDDISSNGYFAIKRGKSIQDHLHLVDVCKSKYSQTIDKVENMRIGVEKTDGKTTLEGKSFDFEFPNEIDNLEEFIKNMFDSTMLFKLWGLKSKISDNYFKIMAVDLHTGHPIDFEIAKDIIRVYLFKGSCGNTILRLFTNLQMYYDSQIICRQLV